MTPSQLKPARTFSVRVRISPTRRRSIEPSSTTASRSSSAAAVVIVSASAGHASSSQRSVSGRSSADSARSSCAAAAGAPAALKNCSSPSPDAACIDPVKLAEDLGVIHENARAAGRDEGEIGIEGAIYFYDERFEMAPTAQRAPVTLDECVEYARWWKDFGATRYWVTAPWANLGPEETGVRTPGKKMERRRGAPRRAARLRGSGRTRLLS